jgi:hypothetical protein
VGPESKDMYPYKSEGQRGHTERRGGSVTIEGDTRVIQLQVKQCEEPPGARRGRE